VTAREELENAVVSQDWRSWQSTRELCDSYRKEVLAEVQEQLDFLEALDRNGVDNWSGYDDSWRILEKYQETGEWKRLY